MVGKVPFFRKDKKKIALSQKYMEKHKADDVESIESTGSNGSRTVAVVKDESGNTIVVEKNHFTGHVHELDKVKVV